MAITDRPEGERPREKLLQQGVAALSDAELLTAALKQALALVDVRVLDHFVVAGNTTLSFAERSLL